ncbi:hypothetical protein QBC43DRAFT_284592 [Cladorrhinum sp. PSN259]|nr:hypothetical protein QBC43DRAFT_284592 [Cladorrhinum sp. PSN259]
MGLLPLTYRPPSYVDKRSRSDSTATASDDDSSHQNGKSLESIKSTGSSGGIPPALSFDRIVQGGTCPPCTIRDFMNYLIYVERAAENLQFFLWYKDYEKRFFHDIQTTDLDLSREWTQDMEEKVILEIKRENAENARARVRTTRAEGEVMVIFEGTDFDKSHNPSQQVRKPSAATKSSQTGSTNGLDPFSTPPATPLETTPTQPQGQSQSGDLSSTQGEISTSYQLQANQAFSAAGTEAPFTIQPFRQELARVIATYIMPGAPRQLNLSDCEQKVTLRALSRTTHPSALRLVLNSVESTLRMQAHPNFIRWTICNGNPMRITFARGLGVGIILLSTAVAVLLTLSKAPRGYRAVPAIGWVVGIATLVAAYKGMCVVLHGLHHQHVRPWELFVVDDDDLDVEMESGGGKMHNTSFDHFGSGNSFETEPWVVKYNQRSVIRKIFDREIWVQEPALRQIQDTIFVQSVLFAFICAGILVTIFVNVPGGNLF